MKIRQEVTVGALTILGVVLLFIGFEFLKGNNVLTKKNTVNVGFQETGHMYVSNPVAIKGFRVGKVADINITPTGKHPVVMELNIDKKLKIPDDSRFIINTIDLFGTKEMEIIMGKSNTFIQPGSDFVAKGEIAEDMMAGVTKQLDPLTAQLSTTMGKIDTLIGNINQIVSNEKSSLESALRDASATMKNLKSLTLKVDNMMANQESNIDAIMADAKSMIGDAKKLTSTISNNSGEIDNAIKNFSSMSDDLAKVDIAEIVNSLKGSINNIDGILKKINDGEGTVGKLLSDESLHGSIDSAVNSLDFLLKDLQANPKRYINISVFGGKNKD